MEYLGGKPLCMNQYYQILSSCRVPGPKQDSVINFSKTKKPPMHITVVHNYQVGGPTLCRGEGAGSPHMPLSPRNRHALGISTGRPARLQPQGRQEGPWPAQPGENNAGTSSSALTLGLTVPSAGPRTELTVASGLPGPGGGGGGT